MKAEYAREAEAAVYISLWCYLIRHIGGFGREWIGLMRRKEQNVERQDYRRSVRSMNRKSHTKDHGYIALTLYKSGLSSA